MSSGKREINEGGILMSKPRPLLYVILDDWELGFSIREVDLDFDQPTPGAQEDAGAREDANRLPSAILRFRAQPESPIYFSKASDSKIFFMQPKEEGKHDFGGFCFDVHERTLKYIPRHSYQRRPIYFPIGNKLFALGTFSMEFLDLKSLLSPSVKLGPLSWCMLRHTPLDSMHVISHAVLPNEKTIFFSLFVTPTTYSFHMTEDGSFKWKNLGKWVLPFNGSGCFYPELGTWVGVSLYGENFGHICSCKLACLTSQCCPEVKYSKEYIFTEDPAERYLGSSLIYMGGHERNFLLVECVEVGNIDNQKFYNFGEKKKDNRVDGFCNVGEGSMDPQPCVRMFRLTKFTLKLDENGNLTTGDTRRVRYYKVPNKEMNGLTFVRPSVFCL